MKYRVLLAIVSMASLSVTAAYAHHSYAATYNSSETLRLEGELMRFELRSPHSYVHLQTTDASGDVQRWAVEWSAPGTLSRQGVDRNTLRTGDEIILTVRPSRVTGEYRALMLSLERPKDGLVWGREPDQVVD